MVSSAKFKSLMLNFKEIFDYLNGFKDVMMLDYLLDLKIKDNDLKFLYVNGKKVVKFDLKFAEMKQSYELWQQEKHK